MSDELMRNSQQVKSVVVMGAWAGNWGSRYQGEGLWVVSYWIMLMGLVSVGTFFYE